ncbi:hypothetical protein BKA66DRAFT_541467 [Pyrenochaeta sp. MPI-SDFR-AT-0127]|nr:hypothetical protein BKA66DRAFT_541467 [Pyrenochaeta sp. MPI-SDFR-AT-0127]
MVQRQFNNPKSKFCTKGRARVKTGCLLCTLRKIKCDEGRPVCDPCIATGRVCDGYGIRGGRGAIYGRKSSGQAQRNNIARYNVTVSIVGVSAEEQCCFEWFVCRTAKKLPGTFRSAFWDTIIIQASSSEPAVLHATVALSSAHRREILESIYPIKAGTGKNELERFTLLQYNKAISHIRPYLSDTAKASMRLVLITCMVFTCLEFVRGHYNLGYTHLQNGLKILREFAVRGSLYEPADDFILEAYDRLNVQIALFRYGSAYPYIYRQLSGLERHSLSFRCIPEARKYLDRLLNGIIYVSIQFRQRAISRGVLFYPGLLDHQRGFQEELASWLQTYKRSKGNLVVAQTSVQDTIAYQMLYLYYIIASILVNTCTWPLEESVFDSYTHDFVTAITQTIEVLKLALPTMKDDISEQDTRKFSFTVASSSKATRWPHGESTIRVQTMMK